MTVWAFGGHWMQKNTWFQASVRNLRNWPFHLVEPSLNALLRSPCKAVNDNKWKRYLLLLLLPIVVQGSVQRRIVAHWRSYDMRTHWNHQTDLKYYKKVTFIAYFVLKYDKKREFFKIKNHTQKILSILIVFSWIMLAHTLAWPCEHSVVIGCKKHLISPSLNALLRSPCQAVNDNKWKSYLIWPENTLEPSNWLKYYKKWYL